MTPASFVGRTSELERLRAVVEACAGGRGAVVSLTGEAGYGKTRLLSELRPWAAQLGVRWHRCRVVDFGLGAGEGALRSLAESLLGIEPDSTDAVRGVAIERAVAQGIAAAETAPFLLDLASGGSDEAGRRLAQVDARTRADLRIEALASLIQATSRREPLLIATEDVHWADASTRACLERLATLAGEERWVLVMTTRPDRYPPGTQPEGARALQLDLGPLSEAEAEAMARGLRGSIDSGARRCVDLAAGNPLFLEQLLLFSDEAPASTLADLVQRRLERLPGAEREAVQAASVLGQRVELSALRALAANDALRPQELGSHALVRGEGTRLAFRHALLRDAVYASLAPAQREELHRRAARYYEASDAVLHAEHLELGGRGAALAYRRAAEELARGCRFERAGRLLDHAVGIARDTRELYGVLELRGRFALKINDAEAALRAYERALGAAGDDRERCDALIGLACAEQARASHEALLGVIDRAQPLAEELDWPLERAKLHHLRGGARLALGQREESLLEHEAALRQLERVEEPEWEARCLSGIGDAHYALGQMTLAELHFERASTLAERHGFERFAILNLLMVAMVRLLRSDTARVLGTAQRALGSLERTRDTTSEIGARRLSSMAHLLRGEYEAARRSAELARKASERSRSRRFEAESLVFAAVAESALGNCGAALALAEAALGRTRAAGLPTGPLALGALGSITPDRARARAALEEGSALLDERPLAHDAFWFHLLALRYAVQRDPELVEPHARWLSEFARRDRLEACLLVAELARAEVSEPSEAGAERRAALQRRARELAFATHLLTGRAPQPD